MKYARVFVESLGYELAPVVVTTGELEERLRPVYQSLRIPEGQLETMTGIVERRWWEAGTPLTPGAVNAARKALGKAAVRADDLDVIVYAGVCREEFEPATACHVAAELGVKEDATVYDVSNACLGVLNGMIDVANRIELGQARAGLVVACETAREINDAVIERLLTERDLELFKRSLATLTGGSGAAAVLLSDGSFGSAGRHRLLGGVTQTAPQFSRLCRWGVETLLPTVLRPFMATDAVAVLQHGVALGLRTWRAFLAKLG